MTRRSNVTSTVQEPDRATVLEFMARTQLGAAETARHFLAGANPDRQQKFAAKVRAWASRAKRSDKPARTKPKADAPARQHTPPSVEVVEAPGPNREVAEMETVERLEWLVAYVAAGIEHAHSRGDVHAVSSAAKTLVTSGQALDKAREQRGKLVGLERTAEGMAKSLNVTNELRRRLALQAKHKAKNL